MREIKFRAWDPEHEAMYSSEDAGLDWLFGLKRHGATVMQFTGLKDKNGTEIYEGDICRMVYEEDEGGGWHSDKKVRGRVYFDTHWGVKFDCRDGTQRTADAHWSDQQSAVRDYRNVEVIGNIYESPELLNV